MASAAVRFVEGTTKSALGTLYLKCRVKPGASRMREGIVAVTDGAVELCVAAQAREGEANRAVIKLLSEVLGLAKSDLTISQGLKSRDKTVAITCSNISDSAALTTKMTEQLEKAAKGK
ncbi:YggU-like protein [Colletotrichum sublineola]|nr:YggU-like protein [Colletotrichum sublineola]